MSWQPSYDYPPPPPPSDMPPLPRGPPPPVRGAYQFGGHDQSQNQNTHSPQPFSFTPINSAPRFPREADTYRPSRSGQESNDTRRRPNQKAPSKYGNQQNSVGHARRDNHRPFRGRGNRHHATADRPLLQIRRDGSTPERMIGMNDHEHIENRFLDVDDMSDSAEEAMDESDQDEYEPTPHITTTAENTAAGEEASVKSKIACDGELSIDTISKASKTENPIPPKWSNPEYYTALPPPDESQRKKRDVVKLIRKARVSIEKASNMNSQVATNDDFISFGAEEDAAKEIIGSSNLGLSQSQFNALAVPDPAHSSTFNQPQYSADTIHAPGTNGQTLSSTELGPPPSKVAALTVNYIGTAAEVLEGNLKRKRSVDISDTGSLRAPKRKKGTGPFSNGYVIDEWVSPKPLNPIPWVIRDHRMTEQPGFRLHKEIIDFYEFVKPQKHEQVIREELLGRLRHVIQQWRADLEVHTFGSFAAGLYLPTADMDLVVISKDFRDQGQPNVCQSVNQMRKLADYLQKNGIAEPWSVEVVGGAKVPLVKFVDCITSLKVDMSFENDTGLVANNTFATWKSIYPAMPIIVTTIKQFLLMRGLNEVVNGGLGGFSVTCLVVSLLQNMPRVQTGEIVPEQNLGEILLEFLDLYGNQLDISRTGICMEPPGYFDKRAWNPYKPPKPDRLAIMDPNKSDNDISGGSRNVMLIFARFSRARDEILNAMGNSNRTSLLDWMLGGNYNTFLWQRARLRKLYSQKRGNSGLVDAGSQLARQCRQEPVQFINAGLHSEHHSNVSLPMKIIEAPNAMPSFTEPAAKKGTVSEDSHSRNKSGGTTAQPSTAFKTRELVHTDVNITAKSRAKAMLKDATKAYGLLCNTQRIAGIAKGSEQTDKNKKLFKAVRREAMDLIEQRKETLANLETPLNSGHALLPSPHDLARPDTMPYSVVSVASSGDTGENDSSYQIQQSHIDDSGFISRAPNGSVTWMAERRAFLFKKQHPYAKDVPMQLSPAAVKKLLDKYHGVEFVRTISTKKAGRKTQDRAGRNTRTNGIGGTSQADAIMID